MNLYLLTHGTGGYDTYDSILVAANNEAEAAYMNPKGEVYTGNADDDWSNGYAWAIKPKDVTIEYIGMAKDSITEPTVIIASFNAA